MWNPNNPSGGGLWGRPGGQPPMGGAPSGGLWGRPSGGQLPIRGAPSGGLWGMPGGGAGGQGSPWNPNNPSGGGLWGMPGGGSPWAQPSPYPSPWQQIGGSMYGPGFGGFGFKPFNPYTMFQSPGGQQWGGPLGGMTQPGGMTTTTGPAAGTRPNIPGSHPGQATNMLPGLGPGGQGSPAGGYRTYDARNPWAF